jgi:hypothetical protein
MKEALPPPEVAAFGIRSNQSLSSASDLGLVSLRTEAFDGEFPNEWPRYFRF